MLITPFRRANFGSKQLAEAASVVYHPAIRQGRSVTRLQALPSLSTKSSPLPHDFTSVLSCRAFDRESVPV